MARSTYTGWRKQWRRKRGAKAAPAPGAPSAGRKKRKKTPRSKSFTVPLRITLGGHKLGSTDAEHMAYGMEELHRAHSMTARAAFTGNCELAMDAMTAAVRADENFANSSRGAPHGASHLVEQARRVVQGACGCKGR